MILLWHLPLYSFSRKSVLLLLLLLFCSALGLIVKINARLIPLQYLTDLTVQLCDQLPFLLLGLLNIFIFTPLTCILLTWKIFSLIRSSAGIMLLSHSFYEKVLSICQKPQSIMANKTKFFLLVHQCYSLFHVSLFTNT